MKNSILFTFVLCSLSLGICRAQWQPEIRLTNNPAISRTSFNNAWCIAANGNTVHVVWYDKRDGNDEIYYKRSTDGGVSWLADLRLTNSPDFSLSPSVAVSGLNVHLIWEDHRDGNYEIYYKRSTNGGSSWGADIRLTNNASFSTYCSVSVSGSVVHAVWQEDRDGNPEIYYKRSTDGGVSWLADARLTANSAFSLYPSVAVSGSVVHVVWQEERDGNDEAYYKRSTNGGVSWGADTRLTNNPAYSGIPSVSVSGSVVHVVWYDERDGNYEIYYKRSTDGGVSWGADSRLTNNSGVSNHPSVTASGQDVHVVWSDYLNVTNPEIYYTHSSNGGTSWGSDLRLTNNTALSVNPSVSVSGSIVHVVWHDERDGNYEIYYRRDPTGNPVGIININSEIPEEFSLSQNYPNPFNPTTKIKFALPNSSFAELVVYDMLGREVETIFSHQLKAGTYEAEWSAGKLSSGVYFYRLRAEGESKNFSRIIKMILIK